MSTPATALELAQAAAAVAQASAVAHAQLCADVESASANCQRYKSWWSGGIDTNDPLAVAAVKHNNELVKLSDDFRDRIVKYAEEAAAQYERAKAGH